MIRRWSALSSVLLAILFLLVVYREVTPEWKRYQLGFRRMEEERLRDTYEAARKSLDNPEIRRQLQELKAQRDRLRAGFQNAETQKRYHAAVRARREIEERLERAGDRVQRLRADSQSLERDYLLASEPRRLAELEKKLEYTRAVIAQALATRDELKRQADVQRAAVAGFTEGIEAVERKLAQTTAEHTRLAADLAKIRARKPEIQQIMLDELNLVDRCTTCHIGTARDLLATGPATARRHPGFYLEDHPPGRFGCASCHAGQPRATSNPAAHGDVKHWPAPLIPIAYLGGSCGKCHREEELPFEPYLNDGRRLFADGGCAGCHEVEGFRAREKIGPDLSRIGDKLYAGWLARWLKEPRAYLPRTRMPDFLLNEGEIEALSAFLLELRGPDPLPDVSLSADEQLSAAGEKVFKQARCISCHAVNGRGGTLGPDLGRVAGKIRPAWLYNFLKDPRKAFPATRMPRYRFDERELRALTSFVVSRFRHREWPAGENAAAPAPALAAQGRSLVRHYGCYGCHEIPGFEKVTRVGAELNSFGDKSVERLDFGMVRSIPHDWYSWTRAKLQTPRVFRDGLKMPDYRFSDPEAASLTVFLRSLSDEAIPPGYRAAPKPPSDYVPEGEFGKLVEDLKCFACHSIRGRGGTLAPDLTYEGSRVRGEWLAQFLRKPDTIRLYLQERMPRFGLTETEVRTIVSYMKAVLINNAIPEGTLSPADRTPAVVERGRRLYFERYACHACHQLGAEGGAIGPELTNVSSRLTEGWLLAWLKGSRKLAPGVKEPQYNMSDEESRALAAFLLAPHSRSSAAERAGQVGKDGIGNDSASR